MPRKQKVSAAAIQRIAKEFKLWRAQKKPGERIPQRLWDAAVQLCKSHGVYSVLRSLKLDYYALKKRLGASTPPVRSEKLKRKKGDSGAPKFVELPLPGGLSFPTNKTTVEKTVAEKTECVLEIENKRGEKLKLELRGAAVDLEQVVRLFWDSKR